MSNEPTPTKQQPRRKANRPALVAYMVALFAVAFLLLAMSYFMQQRRTDQQLIEEGIQKNASALQITQSVQKQNESLRQEISDLKETNEALNETVAAQAEQQEKVTQAMDWLWRIQREYFQRRYTSARQMIQTFEASGLKEHLPAEPPVDPDYRSPLEQYQAIYDSLF